MAHRSESEWQSILSPMQYRVLRLKQTERPFTGEFNSHYESGTYKCVGCNNALYSSAAKFDAGCGWPTFYEALDGAIDTQTDSDGRRTEIVCADCGGHIGHLFHGEGFPTPTDQRHCVNSICLKFCPE